ncbi:MAG TPA: isoprenylcysteine carboxylmethyltransferase family protein [Myxococcota bacterium]|nr:isoprenylcysteine carboxylmethyltransferase family protein [Myxococcota bacterium]
MEFVRRVGALLYGVACYLIFFLTFLYMIGFVGGFVVPKTIDSGSVHPYGWAIDVVLLASFGLQHSVMARPGWKRFFTQWVPRSVERSSYVLASSAIAILLFWQWRPLPTQVWELHDDAAVGVVTAIYLLGYAIVLEATLLIDHFDLFGLRQVWLRALGRPYTEKRFVTPNLYKHIRHPLYLGWLVTFWAAPTFTVGHLLFATAMTSYIMLAIPLEENDLAAQLGKPYLDWRERTPMFVPRFRKSAPHTQVRVPERAR